MTDRTFVGFVDAEQQTIFINLAQIRHVVVAPKDGILLCTLMFSEQHTVVLNGRAALSMANLLIERGIALNGEALNRSEDITSGVTE